MTRLTALLIALCVTGCAMTRPKLATFDLPQKYTLESNELLVLSDFRLKASDPLIVELKELRREIVGTLELPDRGRQVVVYLFSSDEGYRQYMQQRYPDLPDRRAFFIGTATELAVYAHWSEQVREDLRHEYTHGVLHACLKQVPLWLDEGIAEYFEVATADPDRLNNDYVTKLQASIQGGWQPNLPRLERLEEVDEMQRADYQEAWAWVHFLLHHTPESREVLQLYVQSLNQPTAPGSLADTARASIPAVDDRLLSYVGSFTRMQQATYTEP